MKVNVKIIHVGDKVITILGSGVIADYNPGCKMIAVKLDASCGQEWFHFEEIEL